MVAINIPSFFNIHMRTCLRVHVTLYTFLSNIQKWWYLHPSNTYVTYIHNPHVQEKYHTHSHTGTHAHTRAHALTHTYMMYFFQQNDCLLFLWKRWILFWKQFYSFYYWRRHSFFKNISCWNGKDILSYHQIKITLLKELKIY